MVQSIIAWQCYALAYHGDLWQPKGLAYIGSNNNSVAVQWPSLF
jgi:hypothetical protein